jgi:hypothetical protein
VGAAKAKGRREKTIVEKSIVMIVVELTSSKRLLGSIREGRRVGGVGS